MPGKIPQDFIDDLLTRIDIVEVINARVQLRKTGAEYSACCPFHSETDPSFTVSPIKQFYHCFGCGVHGTAIGFLMAYEHLGFVEAVEELAHGAGLRLPQGVRREEDGGHQPLYPVLAAAATWYRRQLQGQQGAPAAAYLEARGVDTAIAEVFGLGYAPEGWRNLNGALGSDRERHQALISTGLLVEKEANQPYDRFRGRLMFPIRDRRGRVIGFGGRVLGEDKPKYLNSPETPLFHKGRELYGLYEARQAVREFDDIVVVEGYLDVVALAQFGIRNVVATLGTATTPEHLSTLFRLARQVVFCFDGDRAGRAAAWKALQTALPELRSGRQVRFMFVPEGEDPDSLVRTQGVEAFRARLPSAQPLSEFLFERLAEGLDVGSADGQANLVEACRGLLQRVPDRVFQHLLVRRLAELIRVEPNRLERDLGLSPGQRQAAVIRAPKALGLSPVAKTIALVLQHPELAPLGSGLLEDGDREVPGVGLLLELLELLRDRPNLKGSAIVERWRDTDRSPYLERLLGCQLEIPQEGRTQEFTGLVARLQERFRERRMEQLLARAKILDATEKRELSRLLSRLKG